MEKFDQQENPSSEFATRIIEDAIQVSRLKPKQEARDGNTEWYFEIDYEGKREKIAIEAVGKSIETIVEQHAHEIADLKEVSFREMAGESTSEKTKASEEDIEATKKDIVEGLVDMVMLRNEAGKAIGYIETELFSLAEKSDDKKESILYDWMICVDATYRRRGLANALYLLAAQRSIEKARKEGTDLVAFVSHPVKIGDESFLPIAPTYPFVKTADGKLVEIKNMPVPEAPGCYTGDPKEGPLKFMICYADGRKGASSEDVLRILDSLYDDELTKAETPAEVAVIEDIKKFYASFLKESQKSEVLLLTAQERVEFERSNPDKFFDSTNFSSALKGNQALADSYHSIIEAVRKINAEREEQ